MASSALRVVQEHRNLRTVTEDLVREHHPATPAGAVIMTVRRCRDELVQAGVRAGLSVAVESMARARLQQGFPEGAGEVPLGSWPRPRRPLPSAATSVSN